MRNSQKKTGILILFILIGSIGGTIIGDFIGKQFRSLSFLTKVYSIGTVQPFIVNLKVIDFTFGFNFNMNIMSIIGIVLAIIIYRKL